MDTVSIEGASAPRENSYFGYNIFDRSINFDNIPVPTNFTLGPGDKIISLWGETNLELVIPLVKMKHFL